MAIDLTRNDRMLYLDMIGYTGEKKQLHMGVSENELYPSDKILRGYASW